LRKMLFLRNATMAQKWCNQFLLLIVAALATAVGTAVPTAVGEVIDGLAAIVNDDIILASEIDDALELYRQELSLTYSGEELMLRLTEAKDFLLDRSIEEKLLLQQAKRLGLVVSDESVTKALDEIKSQFASEAEFEEELARSMESVKDLRQRIGETLLVQRISRSKRQELAAKVSISEDEVRQYYDEHAGELSGEARVRLSRIFMSVPEDSTERQRARVRARAEHVLSEARKGADFAELAAKYSEGPDAGPGGDLGYVRRGELKTSLEDVVFSLKEGAVSDVVEDTRGVQLFKATEVVPEGMVSLAEVRQEAEAILRQKKAEELYTKWIDKLRREGHVVIQLRMKRQPSRSL